MPSPNNPRALTWRRLSIEVEHARRTCRAILETELLEDAKILARGLLDQINRWVPAEPTTPQKRKRQE